jgi:hypothetical protein
VASLIILHCHVCSNCFHTDYEIPKDIIIKLPLIGEMVDQYLRVGRTDKPFLCMISRIHQPLQLAVTIVKLE